MKVHHAPASHCAAGAALLFCLALPACHDDSAAIEKARVAEASIEKVNRDLAQLHIEQEQQTLRLIETRIAIEESEARAKAAQVEEARSKCLATNAKIHAQVSLGEARCLEARAAHQQCRATGERTRSDGTLVGCMLGLGAAALSGGAAAPWALGGCAAGRVGSEASVASCTKPKCSSRRSRIRKRVLRRNGLTELARCDEIGETPPARVMARTFPASR